jgi:hypothetical protein
MGKHQIRSSTALLALAFAIFFGAPFAATSYLSCSRTSTWLLTLAATLGLFAAIAKVAGKPLLTDERGRWSLSRLQLLSWTGFLLPTLWAMVVLKFQAAAADPLAINMNDNLWALMGISAASFVSSPILLERKRSSGVLEARAIDPDALSGANATSGEVRDLFRGEEISISKVIDISRVQMFLFTAMALFVYFILCWRMFTNVAAVSLQLPPMSEGLVTLIGISHATYLAGKIPKHT